MEGLAEVSRKMPRDNGLQTATTTKLRSSGECALRARRRAIYFLGYLAIENSKMLVSGQSESITGYFGGVTAVRSPLRRLYACGRGLSPVLNQLRLFRKIRVDARTQLHCPPTGWLLSVGI
ncbi:MAG TPA: hypothetical protein DDY28_11360 [Hyphomonas atlantica]|nr:hypothetical protein [Hyphomonas atlantica]